MEMESVSGHGCWGHVITHHVKYLYITKLLNPVVSLIEYFYHCGDCFHAVVFHSMHSEGSSLYIHKS